MKIVHISKNDFDGAGLCALRICRAERALGHNAEMIVLHKRGNDNFVHTYGRMAYFMRGVKRKFHKLTGMHDEQLIIRRLAAKHKAVYTLPVSNIDVTKIPTVSNADVVHIHWVGDFVDFPSFCQAMKHRRVCVTLHDENLIYGIANQERQCIPDNPIEQKYRAMKLHAIAQLEHLGVVFLSRMGFRRYSSDEMLATARKTIIYNSVDSNRFVPVDRGEARKELGLDDKTKVFAFMAINIDEPRKGLNYLSEALMKINPDYRIIAIGRNRNKKTWPNVIEAGRQSNADEIVRRLSAADFFCMPSFKEAFAQAPLEAMSCGLPVIAFPCSGTEELINPSNGIICSDFTVDALTEAISKALQQHYDAHAIRQNMISNYSPEKLGKEYIDFYKTL